MMPRSTTPTLTVEQVSGGEYRVTVRFPSGYLRCRPPVVGPPRPSIAEATTAALAKAGPIIAQILTPREVPDYDADRYY